MAAIVIIVLLILIVGLLSGAPLGHLLEQIFQIGVGLLAIGIAVLLVVGTIVLLATAS